METKLTKQSEAILEKLMEDVRHNTLTNDELIMVHKGLAVLTARAIWFASWASNNPGNSPH